MSDSKSYDEAQRLFSLPTQSEANYQPAGGTMGRACSNCRFYLRDTWDGSPRCHLIDNYPEPIEPNGVCDRHEVVQPAPVEEMMPVPVVIVDELELEVEMALGERKTISERVKSFFAARRKTDPQPKPDFVVFKAANGRNAWIARYSGKFIDRQDEIIADEANERFAQRVQAGDVPMPELWMWHNKATKHGQAVYVWKADGFMCAAGYFDDNARGQRAFDYYQQHAGAIKLSHMFHYPLESKIDGVYYDINTIEITTLPDGAEAFPYTSFMEIQTMSIPEVGQTMIRDALGDDALQAALQVDKQAAVDTKSLEGQGIASKYANSPIVAQAEHVKQLEASLADAVKRLEAAEAITKDADVQKATVGQLTESVKQLTENLDAQMKANNALIERLNALELRSAELTDVQAPASESKDTLLSERAKSMLDKAMEAAKSDDQLSFVEKLLDGKPAVTLNS